MTTHANRAKVPVNRKAYLRWCLLGVFGAQRFYAKQWKMGLLYPVSYTHLRIVHSEHQLAILVAGVGRRCHRDKVLALLAHLSLIHI